MKLFLLALTVVAAWELDSPAVNMGLIKSINENPNAHWKAGVNSYFAGRTMKDIIPLMGTHVDPYYHYPNQNKYRIQDLPEEFDSAENWPNCPSINLIRDQGECGSCWAISSAEVMTDRWCIATDGQEDLPLSAQDITSCFDGFGTCKGCQGGNPQMVFMMYWPYSGAVTGGLYKDKDSCYPYQLQPCGHHTNGTYPPCKDTKPTPKCPKKCTNPGFNYQKEQQKYKGKDSGTFQGEEAIMNEIYANGPVVCAIHVYEDFLDYKSGVYHHEGGGKELGGHAVKIVGWGVDQESGDKYWKVANSWNEDWGDHGFIKILKGEDECGIESWLVTAGTKA